jgi:hypothetical protein
MCFVLCFHVVMYAYFSSLHSAPHVMWIDNYSKIFRVNNLTEASGPYRDCLWTGEGIHKYIGAETVDMNFSKDEKGIVIPIMPDDMFIHSTHLLYACTKVDDAGSKWYDKSNVKRYSINNIPLTFIVVSYMHMLFC